MDDLEQQLRNALARKDAPDWFEAKVMAAARRETNVPVRRLSLRWRWVSALAVALLVTSGVVWQQHEAAVERTQGEQAKARLELALKITRTKLHKIEQRLNEVENND